MNSVKASVPAVGFIRGCIMLLFFFSILLTLLLFQVFMTGFVFNYFEML